MNDVDKYLEKQPKKARDILVRIRQIVHKVAPDVMEKMGYGVPEFNLNGPLIYFAGFKNHIGIYPTYSGIDAFKEKVSKYKTGKGSVQFPLDKPIPYDLIEEIIRFKADENLRRNDDD